MQMRTRGQEFASRLGIEMFELLGGDIPGNRGKEGRRFIPDSKLSYSAVLGPIDPWSGSLRKTRTVCPLKHNGDEWESKEGC